MDDRIAMLRGWIAQEMKSTQTHGCIEDEAIAIIDELVKSIDDYQQQNQCLQKHADEFEHQLQYSDQGHTDHET